MKKVKILVFLSSILLLAQACQFFPMGGQTISGGILISTDTGESWQVSNKLLPEGRISGVSVSRIRIDESNPDILYIGSHTHGVYTSTDAAGTWTKILNGPKIFDLQINPNNSDEIIAGGISGQIAKVYMSRDQGQSWTEIYSEAKGNSFVSALIYDRRDPRNILLGLSTGEIIKSVNEGVSWNLQSKLDSRILKIEISPTSSANIKALTVKKGIYSSYDGGKNWELKPIDKKTSNFRDFSSVPQNFSALYVGGDLGLFRTTDDGKTWQKLKLPLHEQKAIVTVVAISKTNANEVYAAVGQTFYKSNDSGQTWQTRSLNSPGSVRDLAISPKEANYMYLALGQPIK